MSLLQMLHRLTVCNCCSLNLPSTSEHFYTKKRKGWVIVAWIFFNIVSDASSDATQKSCNNACLVVQRLLLTLFIFQSLSSPSCSAARSLIMIRLFTLLTLLIAQLQHNIDLFLQKPSRMHSQEITDMFSNMINVF